MMFRTMISNSDNTTAGSTCEILDEFNPTDNNSLAQMVRFLHQRVKLLEQRIHILTDANDVLNLKLVYLAQKHKSTD